MSMARWAVAVGNFSGTLSFRVSPTPHGTFIGFSESQYTVRDVCACLGTFLYIRKAPSNPSNSTSFIHG